MSEAALPSSWAEARDVTLANAPWIFLLLAGERAVDGHYKTAGIALLLCFVSFGVAIYWKAFQGLTKPQGRRRLALVLITLGGAILATGIYMLASQGSAITDNGQLHVVKQQAAPEPPPPPPPIQPLTLKEEEALQGLSVLLNSKGAEVIRVSDKLLAGFKPIPQMNNERLTPAQLRDRLQELVNLLSSMERAVYREFIPANRYYQAELLSALGAPTINSADIVESPIYRFQRVVSDFNGKMETAATIAEEAKNTSITTRLMDFAFTEIPVLQTAEKDFKSWIESCNSRIEQRKAQK